jgi:hypothetical protein
MRIPNPRLQRIASLVKGAEIEPGDGELILTPLIQPIIELTSPVNKVIAPGITISGTFDDSFFKFERSAAAGISAGGSFLIVTIAAGAWEFEIESVFQFSGTNNQAAVSQINLLDPDGVQAPIFEWANMTSANMMGHARIRITFQRDGFQWQIVRSATVGGDLINLNCSINAKRIL